MNQDDDSEAEAELTRLKGLPSFRFTQRNIAAELAEVETSVYRWWYEFLRLSEDYWFLCRQSRGGEPRTNDKRFAQVYRDFGDVQLPFHHWWRIRGRRIFRETMAPSIVRLVNPNNVYPKSQSSRWGSLIIEVPLSLTRNRIMRQVGKILDEHESERPRLRVEASNSKYPINPVRYQLHTLQTTHDVHCLYRELIQYPEARNLSRQERGFSPVNLDVDQFRIGRILHLNRAAERLIGDDREVARRKNTMRATVGRYLSRAKLLIANVELGEFPKFSSVTRTSDRFTPEQLREKDALHERWLSFGRFSQRSEDEIDRLVQQDGLPSLTDIRSSFSTVPARFRGRMP
jgi:hypothetical protein